MFMVHDFKLDSTSLAQYIKIFQETQGDDIPMEIDFFIKDIDMKFKPTMDLDVIMEYTFCISFRADTDGAPELIYDEFRFHSGFNMVASDDLLHIDLRDHRIIRSRSTERDSPIRNSLDMTVNDYQEFIEDFSFTVSEFKKWLNDVVLRGGIYAPYTMNEFDT
jgi:hypothetical protein